MVLGQMYQDVLREDGRKGKYLEPFFGFTRDKASV